jgi:hypothetical protein
MPELTPLEREALRLELEVTDRILSVANCYDEVTTSDLQGIAQAEAKNLITDLKKYWKVQ